MVALTRHLLRTKRLRHPAAWLTDDTPSHASLPVSTYMEVSIGDRQVTNLHATAVRTTRTALPTEVPATSERPQLTSSRLSFLVSPLLAAQWYRNSSPYYHICERL
jgi:hypothetical protein